MKILFFTTDKESFKDAKTIQEDAEKKIRQLTGCKDIYVVVSSQGIKFEGYFDIEEKESNANTHK